MHRIHGLVHFALISIVLLTIPSDLEAQWNSDSQVNNPVCVAPGNQSGTAAASDGAGGAIIIWVDQRSGNANALYAQKIDAHGTAQWAENDVVICAAAYGPSGAFICSDGEGGAYITWIDKRNGIDFDVFAVRIASTGTLVPGWLQNGTAVSAVAADQSSPRATKSLTGGIIIAWADMRNGISKIYTSSLTSTGAVASGWTANGKIVSSSAGNQISFDIAEDTAGGALYTWMDFRSNQYDVFVQRFTSSGSPAPGWPVSGRAVSSATSRKRFPHIISDGSGGTYVSWVDHHSSTDEPLHLQRLQSSGSVAPGWPTTGKVLTAPGKNVLANGIASDGAGGIFVVTKISDETHPASIYGHYLLGNGSAAEAWPSSGKFIASTSAVGSIRLVPVALQSAVITWDYTTDSGRDIKAIRVGAEGVAAGWDPVGTDITTAPGDQYGTTVVADGNGGAIFSWTDTRAIASDGTDIYSAHVPGDGAAVNLWELY